MVIVVLSIRITKKPCSSVMPKNTYNEPVLMFSQNNALSTKKPKLT